MSEFHEEAGNGHRALGRLMAQILPYVVSLFLTFLAGTGVANTISVVRLEGRVLNLERNLEKLENHVEKIGGPH